MELFDYASKNLPSKAEEFYMNPEEDEDEDEDESPAAPLICTPCGKGFKTNQAMNGHMKYNVVESLEAGPNRLRWGATKKFVWKQTLDKHGPEAVVAAFTLIELSRSKSYIHDSSDQMNKKRKTMESHPLDLDEKKHMHDASENCNTSSPSDQALVEHSSSQKKSPQRKRKVEVEVKSESGSQPQPQPQPHVCEVCNKSYATGQELGGHKRAHFKKDPSEVEKSPEPNRKRKRKVKSESGSHSHVCEVCNKSYPTGHQLGGHMRAHPRKDPAPINEVPNGGEAALDA